MAVSTFDYSINSGENTKVHTIKWTVFNITQMMDEKNENLVRHVLQPTKTEAGANMTADADDNSRFQVKMIFLGRTNDLVEIYFSSPNSVSLTLLFKYYCAKSGRIKEFQTQNLEVNANKWEYVKTFFKSNISRENLDLNFEFVVKKNKPNNIPKSQLVTDLELLLNDELLSDFIMRSADGQEFKVHKVILACRCIVLRAHLLHNTKECQNNIIETAFDAEVLGEVLSFLYSGEAPNVHKIPERILEAAEFYQLNDLKSLCEISLNKKLTIDNAIETLQLADLYNANKLKELTLEFIRSAPLEFIVKTEGWAKFESPKLTKRILEYIVEDNVSVKTMNTQSQCET